MMKRPNNVLPFPSENQNGNSLKAFAIFFYVLLAWMLVNPIQLLGLGSLAPWLMEPFSLNGDSLGLLMVLGLLYAVGVRYRSQFMMFIRGKTILIVILALLLFISVLRYLPVLVLLGGLYWFLVARSGREAPYFLRFHLLTALIFNSLVLLPLLVFQSCMNFMDALFKVLHLDAFVSIFYWYTSFWPYAVLLIFWLPAIFLSLSVLQGRTPYIQTVTNNVRHWA